MTLTVFGTIVAASIGHVVCQIALTVTGGDNGFVTMFLNLVPALTALISLAQSHCIADLHFVIGATFFLDSAVIAASLVLFSLKSWTQLDELEHVNPWMRQKWRRSALVVSAPSVGEPNCAGLGSRRARAHATITAACSAGRYRSAQPLSSLCSTRAAKG